MENAANNYISYFGYGSLVNPATHRTDIQQYSKATLKGWRRQWVPRTHTSLGGIALLSVQPHYQSEIDGLVILDHARNQAALDEREVGYDRTLIPLELLSSDTSPDHSEIQPPTNVYVAKREEAVVDNNQCLILRSYLDAVMQGYFNNFGAAGLHRFIASTDNFEIGLREDRDKPAYPRSVTTSKIERDLFDQLVPPAR